MNTRDALLNLFELNKGTYLSGETIAKKLCLSRTSIWKGVKKLQAEGYEIFAVSNRGYCLSSQTDILSLQGIKKYLTFEENLKIEVFSKINSTNSFVKEKAAAGEKEGYVVVANEQTNGRSRQGKKFFSPADSGVYLSILLRPKEYFSFQARKLTAMAAVSVCETIEKMHLSPEIQWIDDILIDGKKVCGILTEASVELESNQLEYVILGIGINLYPPKNGFPDSLKNIAGTIFSSSSQDAKNKITAEFLKNFMSYYSGKQSDYLDKYRKYCITIGKKLLLKKSENSTQEVIVKEITENCELSVTDLHGGNFILSSANNIQK